jgi:hypothetical protein
MYTGHTYFYALCKTFVKRSKSIFAGQRQVTAEKFYIAFVSPFVGLLGIAIDC